MSFPTRTIVGKTVVVTGANRGLGLGLAKRLLSKENDVVATTRNPSEAKNLQKLKLDYPGRLFITSLDVSSEASITSWADSLAGDVRHVDLLINNAGVYGRRGGFQDFTSDDFMETFRTNTVGPFLVAQHLHRRGLLGPPASLVVNVSSVMASHGDQAVSSAIVGGYAYRASKAALNIVNKAMSMELLKDNIECVLVHPGYIRTDMNGNTGSIEVEESVNGILHLLETKAELTNRFFSYDGQEIPW